MPPAKSEIWQLFLAGAKQNNSHLHAHCLGCLEKHHPDGEVLELDSNGFSKLSSESWVTEACKDDVGGVFRVKESMIAHILGKNRANPCLNVSAQALKIAKTIKKGKGKRSKDEASENEADDEKEGRKLKKLLTKVKASMKQSQLKVFCGINIPFTPEQEEVIQKQFLWATVSANLPFQWIEDPEVMTLFLLFWLTAGDVIPSQKQVSGQLLNNANDVVTDQLKTSLQGKYVVLTSDGWKDESHNAVTGVNLAVNGKTYLVDFILANSHKKDGDAMCHAFKAMIDKAEEVYGMYVVALCSDNDSGSQRRRKNVVLKQPYLFGLPCCAHQNTHFIVFDRLQNLKTSMQLAVFTWRNDIIAVQVGAEKNQKKKKKLSNDAAKHCDEGFWHQLKTVVDDLELICLGLNMNQTDIMRPD
ncbi:hypothetical protein C0995_014055 [Termitomyces sp. Mi166|nr:hypothetical protein C0995_014055 [Termitomyces sp. Mi166\